MCDFSKYYFCSPQPQIHLPCNNNVPDVYIPQGKVPIFQDLRWEILSSFLLEIKSDKNVESIINGIYSEYMVAGFSSNLTLLIDEFVITVQPFLEKFASKYPQYNFICTLNEGNILVTFNDLSSTLCLASSSVLTGSIDLLGVVLITTPRTDARTASANFISAANSYLTISGVQPFATVAIGVAPIATYNTICKTDLLTTLTGAILRLIVIPATSISPGLVSPSKEMLMEGLKTFSKKLF